MTNSDVIVIELPAVKLGREPTHDERLIGLYDTITRVCDQRDRTEAERDQALAELDAARRTIAGLDRALTTLSAEHNALLAAVERDYKPRHRRRHRTGNTEN